MALCVIVVSLCLPKQARFRYEYEKGKIWLHKDLISPYSYAIKKTNEEIRQDQDDLLKSINPIYQNNTAVSQRQFEAFISGFDIKWKSNQESPSRKNSYKNAGTQILYEIYQRGIITLNKKFQRNAANYNFTLLTNNVAAELNTVEVFTPETALKYAQDKIEGLNTITNKGWLAKVLANYLLPNYTYDERLTEKLESEALNSISSTKGLVQKGELIIANGSIVTSDIYQKLESLRNAYEEDARIIGNRQLVF
ncbi:MAG TPA: transmembrane HD family protein, partial [Sphingobacteriaceae bacterium]|nr:transmembrane HD family protein [Sphingobacteriaceae bacterium]